MRFHLPLPLLPLLYLLTFFTPTSAFYRGFNVKSNLADGSACKTPSDYISLLTRLKTFPNSITSIRLYSSHTCDTLLSAIPAALSTQTKILVGIDVHPQNYAAEKGALLRAINQHGWEWMLGVSIGSEDLYRGTISPSDLAAKIYDVRGMLMKLPGYTNDIRVGHVDTTNAWFNTSNSAVIRACDFVGADIYPYFQTKQNNNIENAGKLFWEGVEQVKTAVGKASVGRKAGVPSVWVTETGWPNNGPTKGLAVPSIQNAKTYWKSVACSTFANAGRGLNTFWFTVQDWRAVPSFAVLGEEGEVLFDMSCP
ncbi:putative glucan endo-1,3-beta-glucosidase eglC [Leptodontidium sp. 2 PMI_412]|nr:putative glucan endo-1,3-beta-glucosidase eglC [Leptodontidium sp. 2 PMI_412]